MTAAASIQVIPRRRWGQHWPLLAMIFCGLLAWAPLLVSERRAEITGYGIAGPLGFHVAIDGGAIEKYSNKNKLLLIVRFKYENIDRMSDAAIEKSVLYSIENKPIVMAVKGTIDPPKLRFSPNPQVAIEYNAAVIPETYSSENIKSLSDVSRIGGKILDTRVQTVPLKSLGIKLVP